MKSLLRRWGLSVLVIALFSMSPVATAEEPMLAHMVYFSLEDNSEAARERLVASCHEHLSGHEGTGYFSIGVLAPDLDRDVNDRDFDVALHLVFKDKAAHDAYQTHPLHLKFVEENRPTFKRVRVFDSYLTPSADAKPDDAALPDAAAGFAGMIRGEVVRKREDQIVLAVAKVTETWKHSQAADSESLVGRRVLVEGRRIEGKPVTTIARFLAGVKEGEEIIIDVANLEGETLTILELTDEQRERLKE